MANKIGYRDERRGRDPVTGERRKNLVNSKSRGETRTIERAYGRGKR